MDNAPAAGSRGLSSPGGHRSGDPRHGWYRVVARRLAEAVRELERAIGLLRSGTSVKEAALGAGSSEPAYFSRVFARRFGVPPSRWREALG